MLIERFASPPTIAPATPTEQAAKTAPPAIAKAAPPVNTVAAIAADPISTPAEIIAAVLIGCFFTYSLKSLRQKSL